MKVFLMLLGVACLISALEANSFDNPVEEEEPWVKKHEDIFNSDDASHDEKQEVDELIITFPPWRTTYYPTTLTTPAPTTSPTTPAPTTSPTTPAPTTSTTTPATTTSTTTPATTTSTIRAPTPKPYPPARKNPQIYKNFLDLQGPLAGRLYNFVQNMGGKQNTHQKNDILYNFRVQKGNERVKEEEYKWVDEQ